MTGATGLLTDLEMAVADLVADPELGPQVASPLRAVSSAERPWGLADEVRSPTSQPYRRVRRLRPQDRCSIRRQRRSF